MRQVACSEAFQGEKQPPHLKEGSSLIITKRNSVVNEKKEGR